MFSILVIGVASAGAATITIGKGDFYISVGDYDYLPYGYYDRLPQVSFYNMMSDYGTWVSVQPFGRVWRPYVYYDWQPFTHGRWIYTRFGPTWQGYEPWAWVAYHYGNWIWTQQYGWLWIPGYDWHPGRVIWSYSYNTLGWMPAPPQGYNYFCGYLCRERYTFDGYNDPGYPYASPNDYFPFEDYDDFDEYSEYEDYDEYGYDYDNRYEYSDRERFADPYYSYGFRYDPYFFNAAYMRIAPRLWVFIPVNYFTYDNYADHYFDMDFVRYLFDRRYIQINRRGLDRVALERIVRQRVVETPVRVQQMQTDRQTVRVVVPENAEQNIRTHANRVVKEVIAPAFVEKRKNFKGTRARNREVVRRVFKEPRGDARIQAEVETLNDQTVLNEARRSGEERRMKRQQIVKRGIESIEDADREGKLEPMKRAREDVEKRENRRDQREQGKDQSRREETRDRDTVQKRTEPDNRERTDRRGNFDRWKQRETAKFNAWKERQQKEFENWKEKNKDNPGELRKAEQEFQQRMKRAEEQFNKRTQQEQSRNRN
jgi:hypothetical protein